VGWVFDELSYRVTLQGRIASIPIRQTSVWIRDFDRWVEVVEHWSYARSIDEITRLAVIGEQVKVRPFASDRDEPAARAILAVVRGALGRATGDRRRFYAAPERVVVLHPDAETRGLEAITGPSLVERFGDGAN